MKAKTKNRNYTSLIKFMQLGTYYTVMWMHKSPGVCMRWITVLVMKVKVMVVVGNLWSLIKQSEKC